jgi:hypothetical protein
VCELVAATAAGRPRKRNRGRWHIAVPVAAPVEEEDGVVRLEVDQADVAGVSGCDHRAVMCVDMELDALENGSGAVATVNDAARRHGRESHDLFDVPPCTRRRLACAGAVDGGTTLLHLELPFSESRCVSVAVAHRGHTHRGARREPTPIDRIDLGFR